MFRQATAFVTIITAPKASSRHYVTFGSGVDGHQGQWSEIRSAMACPEVSVTGCNIESTPD